MRVVLDTNIVASGVFFGGVPARILAAWGAGEFTLVLSPQILTEYRRVGEELRSKYPELSATLDPILTLMVTNAVIVDAPELPVPSSRDADDDKFLAAALAAAAPVIVSGDKDLLAVPPSSGVKVLTPRQFADRYFLPR